MSKRMKKVEAHLKAMKDPQGHPMAVLKIGQQTVGEILHLNQRLEARSNKGKVFHINGMSEGLRDLLSEYHLHQK